MLLGRSSENRVTRTCTLPAQRFPSTRSNYIDFSFLGCAFFPCRMALSPIDHGKTATAGADGLFKIWRTPQGGKVSPMAPIAGLKEVRWFCANEMG